MLKSTVPTLRTAFGRRRARGGFAFASITNTSLVGQREADRRRPVARRARPPTGRSRGSGGRSARVGLRRPVVVPGGRRRTGPTVARRHARLRQTTSPSSSGCRTGRRRRRPSRRRGLTASARGVSPKSGRIDERRAAERRARDSRRRTPTRRRADARRRQLRIAGTVLPAVRGRDERARRRPWPAKTMSRGSSPTSSVRTHAGAGGRRVDLDDADAVGEVVHDPRLDAPRAFVRAATATGSRPTGTSALSTSPLAVTA